VGRSRRKRGVLVFTSGLGVVVVVILLLVVGGLGRRGLLRNQVLAVERTGWVEFEPGTDAFVVELVVGMAGQGDY